MGAADHMASVTRKQREMHVGAQLASTLFVQSRT